MATEAKITISAVDKTAGAFASIKSNLAGLGGQVMSVTGALGGLSAAGALAGLVAMVRQSANAIDAFNDLADATGASIENISALESVALRTGTSFETVSSTLVKFNGVLKDAKPGSEAEQALRALGLEAEALRRQDPAEALLVVAKALDGFADDSNKARLTQELFGKSLREVAPLLKDLVESGQLVATTTRQQADEADRFNKMLFEMSANAQTLSRHLSIDLVQGINAAARAVREGGLIEGLQVLLTGTDQYKNDKRLVELTQQKLRLETSVARMEAQRATRPANEALIGRQRDELARVEAELKTTLAYRQTLAAQGPKPEAAKPGLPSLPTVKAGRAGSDVPDQARELAAYVNALQGAMDKTRDLTEVEKARAFLLSQGRAGEIQQVRELVLGMAEQVDAEKSFSQALHDKRAAAAAAGDAILKANEEYQSLIKSLLDATPTAQLERQRVAMQALAEEFEAGRISAEQFNEAASTYLGLDKTPVGLDEAARRSEALASSIEDGILKGFREGQSAADIFLTELKAQFAKTVLRPVIQPIAEAGSSLISSGLSAIAGVLGLNSFDVGTDYVPHDQIALIHKGERIVPAAQNTRGGGQAVTVVQNFTVGDVATVAMVREAVAGSERRIAAGMSRSKRYGGAME